MSNALCLKGEIVTNTETCMREMRLISSLFFKSTDFDEQWVLFKAYLTTLHSLTDNDKTAKNNFIKNELLNFSLVLRNIIHHQPAKWHFGKHDVYPTGFSFQASKNTGATFTGRLSLVIQKNTLENLDLQNTLKKNSEKQYDVLLSSLEKINSHVILVSQVIKDIQDYTEKYCKEKGLYTEKYDKISSGYKLIKENA